MASRPLIIASLLGASVAVPYVTSHTQLGQNAANKSPSAAPSANAPAPGTASVSPAVTTIGQSIQGSARLDGAQFTSVNQVFRFDVTKEWVFQNWTRKTTAPTDVGLFSVRVPLVMGRQMTALAGSLTYFFNSQGQVEHISFRGRTGDTTPLVQLLTRYYQLQRVSAPTGEHVYQASNGEHVQSELRTRPEAVLSSNAPQQSVVVELELARPGSQRVLPPRGPALQIPQVAAPPVAESSAPAVAGSSVSSSVKAAASNYYDQIRYATPSEEAELNRKRWPN
jgi:hypothetical protein